MLQNLCPGKVSKLLVVLALFIGASTAFGQSAAFTYQGRLTDGGKETNRLGRWTPREYRHGILCSCGVQRQSSHEVPLDYPSNDREHHR